MNYRHRRWIGIGAAVVVIASLGVTTWRTAGNWDMLRHERDRIAAESVLLKTRWNAALTDERRTNAKLRERQVAREAEAEVTSKEAIEQAMMQKIDEIKIARSSVPPRPQLPPEPSSTNGSWFAELIGDPVYAELIRATSRPGLETRYAPLLETLEVPPEAKEKFAAILFDQVVVELDVKDSAERQGIDVDKDRAKVQAIRMRIESERMDRMRAVLGDAAFDHYKRFGMMIGPREAAVGPFARRLSYSEHPLSREQENQLIELMLQDTPDGRKMPARKFTPEIVAQAERVLSPMQAEALRKFAGVK